MLDFFESQLIFLKVHRLKKSAIIPIFCKFYNNVLKLLEAF